MNTDKITIALLANLIRLLAAELVAGAHRDDVNLVEAAIRSKVNADVPGASPKELAAALKETHEVLTPVLAQVRIQAEAVRKADSKCAASGEESNAQKPIRSNLN